MYSDHVRVCLSVRLLLAEFPHYCTDPDVIWWNGRGTCPLVVHYWADLQSVHGFRCYDNDSAERETSTSACTRSICVVRFVKVISPLTKAGTENAIQTLHV